MATARDVITGALRLIGVASEAEQPTAYQIVTGLEALNELVDQWNADACTVFCQSIVSTELQAQATSFTIGTGGNINVPRPTGIIAASAQTLGDPSSFKLDVVSGHDWIAIQSEGSTSTRPTQIWMDGAYPIATVRVWPVPSEACWIELLVNQAIDPGMTLDTSINFPPAFAQALRFNLAVVLAPEYGREVLPTVQRQAMKSKHSIALASTMVERLDDPWSPRNGYDINTD